MKLEGEHPLSCNREVGFLVDNLGGNAEFLRPMHHKYGDRGFFYTLSARKGEISMIDIRLIRTNPDLVKANIRKKYQNHKLVLVDEVLELDQQLRECKTKADTLRGQRNTISKEIGKLMAQGKREEAEVTKQQVADIAEQLEMLKHLEET